jgi:hypothetical protein
MASTQVAGRRNLGVLTGALFVLLWIAGTVAQGASGSSASPRPTDSMGKVQEYFKASASGAELNAGLQILAAVALLWFAGIMAGFLRRQGRPGSTPDLVLAGGALAAGTLLLSAGVIVSLAGSDVSSDAAVTQALYQLLFWTGGPLHVAALGTMIAAAAYALGGVLPKWLNVFGLVVGVAGVLASLTVVVPPTVMFTPIGRFLGFLWMLIATIMIGLRRSPVAATAAFPATADRSAA